LISRTIEQFLPRILVGVGVAVIFYGIVTVLSQPQPQRVTLPLPTPGVEGATGTADDAAARRVPTRVVIPALKIDLPVVLEPAGYPWCDVAMYLAPFARPGLPGATYIYAHARQGMFLPLLDASKDNNGKSMIGMLVRVYTSDDQVFVYRVSAVHRHVTSLAGTFASQAEQLWLQTSEGPRGTLGKTEVIAEPVSSGPAAPRDAHPVANPTICE